MNRSSRQWVEEGRGIWALYGKANHAQFNLAVFRPVWDREHWHFSLNNKDSPTPFDSREAAQAAAVAAAIAWIDDLVSLKPNLEALQDQPPAHWQTFHHPDCGTQYRGCHPSCCPKDQYEKTGVWRSLPTLEPR